ncbi:MULTISPECIES: hypothetical protein [unclassified Clostridium]|uniref:hypothetical protein n=1 Tax=unclassified Clostridium TaxID=2614128 RepID=UPI0025C11776|nr:MULTISPECIES: hypothetical protein [unclassified Clostridium]
MAINKIENPYLLEQYMEISTAEVIAINRATGMEMFFGTLESDELSHNVDEEPIKGGIYNDTIMTINKNKEIKFKAVDVVSRMDVQLNKLGAKLKTGTVLAWHFPHNYPVEKKDDESLFIPLDELPVDIREVCIYEHKNNKMLKAGEDYEIKENSKEIIIKNKEVKENDNLYVTSYQYKKENVQYADITGKPQPQTFTLIVRKPLFNTHDVIVAWKQYYFPKAKMSGSFTLSGNTEKTKNTEETEFTIEKDIAYDYLGKIMFIPDAEAEAVEKQEGFIKQDSTTDKTKSTK